MTHRVFRPVRAAPLFALLATLAFAPFTPLAAHCDDCVFLGESWEVVRRADLAEYGWDSPAGPTSNPRGAPLPSSLPGRRNRRSGRRAV